MRAIGALGTTRRISAICAIGGMRIAGVNESIAPKRTMGEIRIVGILRTIVLEDAIRAVSSIGAIRSHRIH